MGGGPDAQHGMDCFGFECELMINIKCNVKAEIRNRQGALLEVRKATNLVVNTGLQLVRDLLGGTGYRPNQMQAGDGTSATTATMTELENSVVTKDIDRRSQSTYSVEFQTLLETGDGNGYTLSEIGTFQGSTMLARAIISPSISKTSAIQVTLSHIFTISAS